MCMDKMRGVSAVHVHFRVLGPVVKWTTECQWGCSGSSCDSGTKLSLGPNFYFIGSLIYIQKLTLGATLLVPLVP